jgi:hypothetical protein
MAEAINQNDPKRCLTIGNTTLDLSTKIAATDAKHTYFLTTSDMEGIEFTKFGTGKYYDVSKIEDIAIVKHSEEGLHAKRLKRTKREEKKRLQEEEDATDCDEMLCDSHQYDPRHLARSHNGTYSLKQHDTSHSFELSHHPRQHPSVGQIPATYVLQPRPHETMCRLQHPNGVSFAVPVFRSEEGYHYRNEEAIPIRVVHRMSHPQNHKRNNDRENDATQATKRAFAPTTKPHDQHGYCMETERNSDFGETHYHHSAAKGGHAISPVSKKRDLVPAVIDIPTHSIDGRNNQPFNVGAPHYKKKRRTKEANTPIFRDIKKNLIHGFDAKLETSFDVSGSSPPAFFSPFPVYQQQNSTDKVYMERQTGTNIKTEDTSFAEDAYHQFLIDTIMRDKSYTISPLRQDTGPHNPEPQDQSETEAHATSLAKANTPKETIANVDEYETNVARV